MIIKPHQRILRNAVGKADPEPDKGGKQLPPLGHKNIAGADKLQQSSIEDFLVDEGDDDGGDDDDGGGPDPDPKITAKDKKEPKPEPKKGGREDKLDLVSLFLDDGSDDDDGKPGDKKDKKDDKIEDQFDSLKIEADKIMSPRAADNFKKVKADVTKAIDIIKTKDLEISKIKEENDKLKKGEGVEFNVEKDPKFIELKKEAERMAELVERVSIEESPRFREKYNSRIAAAGEKMKPVLKTIVDKDARGKLIGEINALISMEIGGEESEDAFYQSMNAIIEASPLNDRAKSRLEQSIIDAREASVEKFNAVKNWKETKQKLSIEDTKDVEERAGATLSFFRNIRTKADSDPKRAKVIAKYRETPELKYDETTKPHIEKIEQEIEATVKAGVPTPTLLAYLNLAPEAAHLGHMNSLLKNLLTDQVNKLKQYEQKFGKLKDALRGGSKPNRKIANEPQDEEKEYGMLAFLSGDE